jgi:hypothetical protein
MAPMIYPNDRGDAAQLASRLLDAAGPGRRYEVRTVAEGPAGIAFDVPDEVYGRAFAVEPVVSPDYPAQAPSPPQTPAPEPAPAGGDGAEAAVDDVPAAAEAVAEAVSSPGRQRRRPT